MIQQTFKNVFIFATIVFLQSVPNECWSAQPTTTTAKKAIAAKRNAAKKPNPKKPMAKLDHNAIGFKFFQKGEYKNALKSFDLSRKTDPKNAFGFLNYARALVAINIKQDPAEYCEYSTNWVLLSLASLSKAVSINRNLIAAKLKEIKEPSFVEFRKRPEFKKWESTFSLPVQEDSAIRSFILAHAEWITREPAMPPTTVTLRADMTANVQKPDGQNADGTWKVEKGKIVLETKIIDKSFFLKSISFHFNEGQSSILSTVLVDEQNELELYLGPITDDCS